MCSTVCENATSDSIWTECSGWPGDGKKATADELPSCTSTSSEPWWKPAADLNRCITQIEKAISPNPSSIAADVRDQLRGSIKRNFEGREYIARTTLLQVMSEDVVHRLSLDHMSGYTILEVAKQRAMESRQEIVGYIEMEARILLALCIFVGAPMQTFFKYLETGISDSSLPLTEECITGVEKAEFVRMLENQWLFLPYDVLARPSQVAIPEEFVVPLIFDKRTDLIGSGAYSDVFRVIVDDGHCSVSETRQNSSVYALKRFKDENPHIERSFRREYSVLQELVKIPHDHILLHLATWSQGGVFYMIFPQARYNLRTFMEEVECPGLAAKNVVWFFKQLRGLADAVRHIHALEPLPALFQFRGKGPIVETDQSACHNDIKPENILVFDSGDSSLGVLKISDFGCGRISRKDWNSETQNTEGFYGTPEYESPDLSIYKEASKPNDIWALGCVFLELLDWFIIPRTQKQMSFQSQRYTGPGPTNPAFWYRNPENKLQLKPQVGQKLMELENKYCLKRIELELLLHIIWYLLDVEMKDRCTAEQVYNDLNHLTRQAIVDLGQDPDYFLRPTNVHRTIPLLINAFPRPSWGLGENADDWNPENGGYVAYSKYCDWNSNYIQITDFEGHEHLLGNKNGNRLEIVPIPEPVEVPRIKKKRTLWDKYARILNKTLQEAPRH